MKLLGVYKNGNYFVEMYSDGTKVRVTNDDNFVPAFSECCDVKITDCCDGACKFCYEGCTPNGKHGDILNYKFLDTLHPFTELAINGNDLTHPDLIPFMHKMKEKKIILNMTVNQIHFERRFEDIKSWINEGLIHGLGISLRSATDEFIKKVSQIPNAVIHVINGIVSIEDLKRLAGHNLKILVLGYKVMRRGKQYYDDNCLEINAGMIELAAHLFDDILPNEWFSVVSFDNLAIRQLKVKEHLSDDMWNEFYMGDDGDFTFYIDMVEGKFGKNSLAEVRYPIMDSIDEMFQKILAQNEES